MFIGIFANVPGVASSTARLKDIAQIRGARENQLMGYGLVVGLQGTGDRSSDYTENSLGMTLRGLGVDLKSAKIESKNTAAVFVTATIPAFTKVGDPLEISVGSLGSATSLDGGNLLATALKGADGKVYAMAQGRIILARKSDRGGNPSALPLVATTIPNGALLEREVSFEVAALREIHYQLLHPDFTTASRVAGKINEELSARVAQAMDAGDIAVKVPYNFEGTAVDLISKIENLEIETDRRAKIVVNRRNGTVVLGENVKISPAAIAFNNLRIQIKDDVRETAAALVPEGTNPNTGPDNISAPLVSAAVQPKAARRLQVPLKGASIADIVVSLNEVGAGPEELVSLLQALKAAGALSAEIELQ
jgi:flagellar P-ring protein precursor FlgI